MPPEPSAGALITLEEVTVGYTGPVAGPVSFTVHAGEVLGLGGANGVGKSTLLRAITGTARVHSGAIRRMPGLRISHHQQRPARPPELPLLGHELLRLLDADHVREPLAVIPLMDKPVRAMSGGQFQLLQTWACFAAPVDLILLDEPTNNLDSQAIATLSDLLHNLGEQRAVLLVSHEQQFLQEHCDRIVDLGT